APRSVAPDAAVSARVRTTGRSAARGHVPRPASTPEIRFQPAWAVPPRSRDRSIHRSTVRVRRAIGRCAASARLHPAWGGEASDETFERRASVAKQWGSVFDSNNKWLAIKYNRPLLFFGEHAAVRIVNLKPSQPAQLEKFLSERVSGDVFCDEYRRALYSS